MFSTSRVIGLPRTSESERRFDDFPIQKCIQAWMRGQFVAPRRLVEPLPTRRALQARCHLPRRRYGPTVRGPGASGLRQRERRGQISPGAGFPRSCQPWPGNHWCQGCQAGGTFSATPLPLAPRSLLRTPNRAKPWRVSLGWGLEHRTDSRPIQKGRWKRVLAAPRRGLSPVVAGGNLIGARAWTEASSGSPPPGPGSALKKMLARRADPR